LANEAGTYQKGGELSSQVAKEDPTHLLEGQGANEKIRQLTQQAKIEDVSRERRMRWMRHVGLMRIGNDRVARVAVGWILRHNNWQ